MSKTIFFVFLFSLFQEEIFAQSCKELQDKAGMLIQQGKIQDAIKIGQITLKTCKQESGIESTDYIYSAYFLAALYRDIGDYENAETLYIQILPICKKLFGEEDQDYAQALNELAELYRDIGSYSKAEPLFTNSLAIRRIVLGQEHPDYAKSLHNLARLYQLMGNYNKAEPLFVEALSIRKKVLGEKHLDYISTLSKLATLYRAMGNYNKAEPLYIEVLSIRKKTLGEEHLDYAAALNNLAGLYQDMGNYVKAELLFSQALNIVNKVLGKDDPIYATALNNLGLLFCEMGNYTKAEPLFVEALTIAKKEKGDDISIYTSSLSNLATCYGYIGNYSKAEPLFIEVLTIRKKVLGEEHPDYLVSLSNLSELYQIMGNYSKAEPLFIQAIFLTKKVLGDNHPKYAILLDGLASLYTNMGNYIKAETLYIQTIEIQKKVLGEDHIDYATSLNNLATVYLYMGNYYKAETFILQALEIRKKVFGEDHTDYVSSLNNLAQLYQYMGKYSKAEPLLIQALSIEKKIIGEEHRNYANLLNNLAQLYRDTGNYIKAEPLYIKSLDVYKKMGGERHPDYASFVNNLALLYMGSGYNTKAEPLFNQALSLNIKNWRLNFGFLSGAETSVFLKTNSHSLEFPFSYISKNPNTETVIYLLNFDLLIKNILLTNNRFIEDIAFNSKDTSISRKWQSFKSLRLQISKVLQLSLSEQKNLNALEEQAEALEKELMRNLPEFQQAVLNNNLIWKEVQAKLKPSEAAIDFVSFRYYDKRWTDNTMYAAFLIRPEWTEPKFVNLFREEQLASHFDSTNNSISINNLYNNNPALYNLIWQPMDSLLTGVKRVYVSPSGLLHRISLSAIPLPEGGNLNDRYDIHVMGNVRALAEKQTKTDKTPTSSFLYGGIDYDNEPTVTKTAAPSYEVITDSTLRSLRGGKWSFLKGTSDEVSRIQTISSSSGLSTKVFSKATASEEAFKLLGKDNSPVPSILHIATHGFAFSTPENQHKYQDRMMLMSMQEDRRYVFRQTTDPLTRAGLVMAGGNKVWSTGQTYPNKEDGILTAREISNMDLRGCMLATLSACETGLGEIKGSEGVFGLQRAFKMAGVQHLIVSLWKVPDRETSEFMETFYTNWLTNKLPLREAFRQTQQLMSKKYKPYQWAAFVLVE